MFAENKKVLAIIYELSTIDAFNVRLLTEVQDGLESASLSFHPVLWSEDIENITKNIADLLDCKQTYYAYDKALLKIIVTFNK
jgi:hypothetical protein